MKSFISEDNIEQAICNRLSQPEYGWKRIECSPDLEDQDEVASTGRANPSECILPEVFLSALRRLNPQIDDEILKNILQDFRKDYSGTDMMDTNYKFYNQIRNGIKVKTRNQHREDFDIVKLIDFDHPERNEFHCVNQMWIKGHFRYRRPDVLLFVNGLPVVFIELKNSTVKIEESYNKNLVSYRKDIPNIFAMNQICVLSNGLQTKLGAWNAGYEFFFEWLRVHPEPFEEELIACIPCTELGLQTIAQHADLVHGKDVRDVLAIRYEVLVVRFLYLDGRVFQFDKHHGQSIHEEEHIGTAIAEVTFDPHLVDTMKLIALRMIKVDELHDVEVLTMLVAGLHLDAISYLVIKLVVGIHHIGTRIVLAEVLEDVLQDFIVYLRIQTAQGREEHFGQNALRRVGTSSGCHLVLVFQVGTALYSLPSVFRLRKSITDGLLYIVFTDK